MVQRTDILLCRKEQASLTYDAKQMIEQEPELAGMTKIVDSSEIHNLQRVLS